MGAQQLLHCVYVLQICYSNLARKLQRSCGVEMTELLQFCDNEEGAAFARIPRVRSRAGSAATGDGNSAVAAILVSGK